MNDDKALTKEPAGSAVEDATRLLAEVRARCVALGLSPVDFAALLLPEALLAMMVGGMRQEEVEQTFEKFAHDEIPTWFLRVKRTAGYCDCAREAYGEHEFACAQRRPSQSAAATTVGTGLPLAVVVDLAAIGASTATPR